VLLVVEDNEQGSNATDLDKLTWGVYKPKTMNWTPAMPNSRMTLARLCIGQPRTSSGALTPIIRNVSRTPAFVESRPNDQLPKLSTVVLRVRRCRARRREYPGKTVAEELTTVALRASTLAEGS
jgi:hypothetical protein